MSVRMWHTCLANLHIIVLPKRLFVKRQTMSKDKQWQQKWQSRGFDAKMKKKYASTAKQKTNKAWLKSDFLRCFCFRSKLFGNNFVDFGLFGSCNMTKTIKTNCRKFAAPDTVETSVSNTRRKSIGQIRKFDYLSLTGGGVLGLVRTFEDAMISYLNWTHSIKHL